MGLRRKISAILLSAVILPALLLAPLHRHHPVTDSGIDNCIGCESHIPHNHLEGVPHTDECMVCQFLAIVWLASDEESPEVLFEECSDVVTAPVAQFVLTSIQVPGMRAPPVVFC